MQLSLSGELQPIHRGRVLGLGQLEEHAGELHFYETQANKLSGSEQCGFPSTLATQAGSFAVGHCLALLITRLAGCGSSVGPAVLLAVKGTTTLERGGAPWVLQMCHRLPLLVKGSPLASADSKLRWPGRGHGVHSCRLG